MDAALRENLEAQRDRLLDQLNDLEELKDELDDYDEQRKETLQQLKEFEANLAEMAKGDMTLQSELDATRTAIRAAISDAFKTPEVIRMFAKKEPAALRRRLAEIDRDVKLGKRDQASCQDQVIEILVALKRLGDTLSNGEAKFLQQHKTASMAEFEAVDESAGDEVKNFGGAGSSSSS